jgi:hypothetical protein
MAVCAAARLCAVWCRIAFLTAFRNMFITGTYLVWTISEQIHTVYEQRTTSNYMFCIVSRHTKHCTLRGCSDRCATSVDTLVCNLYLSQILRWYNPSNLLKRVHLVSGDERLAPALRRHPFQPCRCLAGPPLGFCCSQAWLGSTAWILLCGDVQPPDWEIGSGWRVQVGQCSSLGTCVTPEA